MTELEQAAWAVAQRLRSFKLYQLSAEAGVSVHTTTRYLRQWARRGLVVREGSGRFITFSVVEGAPVLPPSREQSPERNMWTAMRLAPSFSARDLAAQATTDRLKVSEDEALRFIRSLLPAGYLKVVQTAIPNRRPAVYRLIRNTGPLPPRECRIPAVWDPNEARWVHLPGAPA
jgi:DNA-binding transcriptional MocR family regulator